MSFLPRRRPASTSPDSDGAESPISSLGKTLTVTGVLDTDGELHVHGNVVGQIYADCFVLGIGGHVEGDVRAREARIGGRLNGRVFALTVAIDSSAEITGRIFHHSISVASGARIDGRVPWRPLNYFETLDRIPEE
ncbi:MAG: bactofilin family protein [Rhizomicrobium sp.]